MGWILISRHTNNVFWNAQRFDSGEGRVQRSVVNGRLPFA